MRCESVAAVRLFAPSSQSYTRFTYGDDVYDFLFSGSSGVDGVHSFHYKCYVLNNFILFFFYCVRRSSVSVDDGV